MKLEKADLSWPLTRELTLCRSLEILTYKIQQHPSNMATAFPAGSFRAAKPYGRHRAPNTPMSNLTKNVKNR